MWLRRMEACARQGRTHSLRDLCHALPPDSVDGNEHALSRLHRVEHRALHGRVAGAAHGDGHVVLCLKGVLDALFDVVHDLKSTQHEMCKEATLCKNFVPQNR